MANKKARPERGTLPEHVEVILFHFLRRVLKWVIKKTIDSIEKHSPDVFRAAAWVYTKEDAKNLKGWTEGTLLAGATLVENIADIMPVPEWARKVIESLGGDLPMNIEEYFNNRKTSNPIRFDPSYTGPKPEDMKKSITDFAAAFRDMFLRLIKRMAPWLTRLKEKWDPFFKGFQIPDFGNLFESSTSKFMSVMFQQNKTDVLAGFTGFFDRQLDNNIPHIRVFKHYIKEWDTQDEWDGFFTKPADVQDKLFSVACQLYEQEGLRGLDHQATEGIVTVLKNAEPMLKSANEKIEADIQRRRKLRKQRQTIMHRVIGAGIALLLAITWFTSLPIWQRWVIGSVIFVAIGILVAIIHYNQERGEQNG